MGQGCAVLGEYAAKIGYCAVLAHLAYGAGLLTGVARAAWAVAFVCAVLWLVEAVIGWRRAQTRLASDGTLDEASRLGVAWVARRKIAQMGVWCLWTGGLALSWPMLAVAFPLGWEPATPLGWWGWQLAVLSTAGLSLLALLDLRDIAQRKPSVDLNKIAEVTARFVARGVLLVTFAALVWAQPASPLFPVAMIGVLLALRPVIAPWLPLLATPVVLLAIYWDAQWLRKPERPAAEAASLDRLKRQTAEEWGKRPLATHWVDRVVNSFGHLPAMLMFWL